MELTLVRLAGTEDLPLLVVGPSLGTSVTALWGRCAELLADRFQVVGWELPGHGHGTPASESFTIHDLAGAIVSAVDRSVGSVEFAYAGDSIGGAVGLQLALDHAARLTGVAVICSRAQFGDPQDWHDRAAFVRGAGTSAMVEPSAERWFAPGFLAREPDVGSRLLESLRRADPESYALVCEALAQFDARPWLGGVHVPLLAIAGCHDVAAPAPTVRAGAGSVTGARYVELDGVGHLAPAEAPHTVATLLGDFFGSRSDALHDQGMAVRRAVLGDEHVDRAISKTTDVTADFQDLITRYAWGTIWTRPGLSRRDRSIAVLTALIAGRHFDELEFHLLAALRNGLTAQEIIEVLLQSAVYVGVPAANTAFAVANRVLGEAD